MQGACDAHVHVIGPAARYPMVAERHYTPGPASVESLQAHLQLNGLQRAVIIQPSVYGTDNTCLLDALAQMQGQARGVAVLSEAVTPAQLRALDAQGVRGVRLNLESAGHDNAAALKAGLQDWAARIAGLGWHVQVYAPLSVVAACAETLRALPVPVVLDHFALWPDASCAPASCQSTLRLLEAGRIHIKLSASYRVPLNGDADVNAVAQRLLALRPDRMLWASDWPHTNREPGRGPHDVSAYRPIQAARLVQERESWLGQCALARQVLVDNPQQLYRF